MAVAVQPSTPLYIDFYTQHYVDLFVHHTVSIKEYLIWTGSSLSEKNSNSNMQPITAGVVENRHPHVLVQHPLKN